ncbi:hypothetical protein QF049_001397 [Paenibacillus sp. W4I10]|nr:hypothetical protein [Paenibacillus sp. W4I10]
MKTKILNYPAPVSAAKAADLSRRLPSGHQ